MSTQNNKDLIAAAFDGDVVRAREAFASGANVNAIDSNTGLAALHIAVGNNDARLARFLIEEANAGFFADRFGRCPTVVAVDCRADDEFSEYILKKEAAATLQP